jgi:hypothetical protein
VPYVENQQRHSTLVSPLKLGTIAVRKGVKLSERSKQSAPPLKIHSHSHRIQDSSAANRKSGRGQTKRALRAERAPASSFITMQPCTYSSRLIPSQVGKVGKALRAPAQHSNPSSSGINNSPSANHSLNWPLTKERGRAPVAALAPLDPFLTCGLIILDYEFNVERFCTVPIVKVSTLPTHQRLE